MSLKAQITRHFQSKMGVWGGLPRLQRMSDLAWVYGYTTIGEIVSNPWLAQNIFLGAASSEVELHDGDLLLDRLRERHCYVVAIQPGHVGGEIARYDFQAYMCNEVVTWQRLMEGPLDGFTHQPSYSNYQTIQPSVRVLMSLEKFWTDRSTHSEEDTNQWMCIHNYLGAREGDRIIASDGRSFIIRVTDPVTLNHALFRSSCIGGTGG